MTNKALDKMCTNCEKGLAFKKVRCPFRSISNDHCEEYEKVKKDLEVLGTFEDVLMIEPLPPKPFNSRERLDTNAYVQYIVKCNNYKLDKEIRKELTQWVIHNIDKETVRKWLENDK